MAPTVSIIIINYNNPHIIDRCLTTLAITEGVDYEVVVVDNGSTVDGTRALLERHRAAGNITRLVLEEQNHFFSGGNNIGVAASNPEAPYVLLLNSDVAFLRPDWLTKQLAWMEGTAEYTPSVWGMQPTVPEPGPKDIISIGWSHDASVEPGHARPEGWCCLMRREHYVGMSTDLPWHGGFEEMVANQVRAGAKCGLLCQYAAYLVHREGGSGTPAVGHIDKRAAHMSDLFRGLHIETLDFTLGPNEHDSYLIW